MNAAKRLEIFRRLHEDNPEPKTELAYTTLRTADCRDSLGASNRCRRQQGHARLFPVANTPEAIHALGWMA
jgi:endonuclease-3